MTAEPETLSPPDAFLRQAASMGIEFEPGDVERLGTFLALLLDANTKFNLTSITDPAQAWTRHIFDSLTLMPLLVSSGAREVIDIGAGGGLPGIPLAICMPNVQFTLVESTTKKAQFLGATAQRLELINVTVVNDRAEILGQDHKDHRARYDAAIARAVGRLPILLELTVPLVKVGGHVLAIKGEKAQQEIEESKPALHLVHAHVIQTQQTPTGTIVVIEKLRTTPRLYPRAPGEPKRSPLGVGRM